MNIILEGPTGAQVLTVALPRLLQAPDVLTWQGRAYRYRGSLLGATYRECELLNLDGLMPGGGMTFHPDIPQRERA